jgi:hypothetical protein
MAAGDHPDQRFDRLELNLKTVAEHGEFVGHEVINLWNMSWRVGAEIDRRIAGNVSRRMIGLGLLVAGLVVQAVGNVVAL